MISHATPDRIMQLGLGFWGSKTLLSAIELGLFTELARGPLDAHTLGDRLDAPPFLIEFRYLVKVERQIACDQIAHAHRTVFVCKDFFGQREREIHFFKPN